MAKDRLLDIVRNLILEFFREKALDVCSIVVFGSYVANPSAAEDVDVVVFICNYTPELAKNPDAIRMLEAELKARWDAVAVERGYPALDPLVVVGFEPIYLARDSYA